MLLPGCQVPQTFVDARTAKQSVPRRDLRVDAARSALGARSLTENVEHLHTLLPGRADQEAAALKAVMRPCSFTVEAEAN